MKFVDRLKQSFIGTSTATITLGGAVSGFRTVAQAIADGDAAIGDEIPMGAREGATWELGLFKVDSPTQLSRVRVLASWSGGAAATFPAGMHEIACTTPADFLNGQDIAAVAALTSVADAVRLTCIDTAGQLRTIAASVLKAYTSGTAIPADTTAPSAPTNLGSSSVTQTSFTVSFTPGADNVGVARSEWSLDGTSWTGIGSATTFNVTGRTAATTYPVRVRTVDTSGNVSTATSLNVTTLANTGDTTAPIMSGSISTSSISTTGYTFSYSAGSDNVAVDHYETSIDGGANWASNGTSLSRTVTGRPASTTDNLRVRAHDAAGNISNVLTATVTTSAAAPTTPTLTKVGAARVQGASTGKANATTDVATGELRVLVSANATEADTAVLASSTVHTVTAAGRQPFDLSGITGTALYMHVVHRVGGVNSAVVSTPLYQHWDYNATTYPRAAVLPSTGTVSGTDRYYSGSDYFSGQYRNISPTPPVNSVLSGWGTSPTEPPPILVGNENDAAVKKNGLYPCGTSNGIAYSLTTGKLWGPDAVRNGPKYFYVQIGDAPAFLMPSKDTGGNVVDGTYIEATG